MSLKLLALGDLHIGRTPTRLPTSLQAQTADYSPVTAWMAAVDLAVRESMDAVLVAGDLVESNQDYFEGLGHLQRGAQTLEHHNIRFIVISGNHDVDVLPRLVDDLPHCELLGRHGDWQSTVIASQSGKTDERLTLWGWSFPAIRYEDNPLDNFPGRHGAGLNIGLLHCDRDQPGSRYAPVSSRDLANASLDAWLLGHIHQPDSLTPTQPFGYLGSVTGLDAGEAGARGVWRLTVEQGQICQCEHVPLAPLRWERLNLDCTGAETLAEVESRLTQRLHTLATQLSDAPAMPRLVGLRLHLTGESAIPSATLTELAPPTDDPLPLPGAAHIQWFVERQIIDLRPALSLQALAQRSDQPGLLARKLLILERPVADAERQALLEQAIEQARAATLQGRWQRLPGASPDAEQIADWLRQSAQDALRAMLSHESGD